ncbi:MAG TPA: BTAD domain-containing putative transcriptional regulator [Solirubrobacteraceae bacterium]|jgi:predicted ATPase/DNA-binding SARP family transcriptional activator
MGDDVLGISLLGAFSITVGGHVIPDDAWRLRKAKALIKLLALAPERRLHADRATELLWAGREEASARNNLHQAIFAARRALDSAGLEGRNRLELHEDVIALCPDDPVRIDVLAFEEAAATARVQRDPAAYRDALDSYDGELLPEDRYEEWTASRRDAVHELRLTLGIELAELQAPEDPAAAIDRLRSVLVDAPLHEPAHRALMRLYVGGGRRQEALAQFQELKLGLRREFEDEPDEVTRRLYREILTRGAGEGDGEGDSARSPTAAAGRPSTAAAGRRPTADAARSPTAAAARSPAESPPAESPNNLPRQLTSFIGRERELAEAAALVRNSRLLTLTGAGGCGKTRLALELAGQLQSDFSAGVWPVELAALGEPELIGPAIAQALDTRLASDRAPEVALAGHIGDRQQLLLLDNCEHLVEPVAHLVEALLRHCPRLAVLATSREPLRVPGEVTWRVPSLSLPELVNHSPSEGALPELVDHSPSGGSLEAESVRLFTVRAGQAAPGFELDDENAIAISTLCHRLDGMPLAIELAAARVGALTPAQIVERLDDSLDLLSGGSRTAMTRQQTLRATLAWSFDLLEPDEQILLRRLAVFAGSFGLEAAEDICAGKPLQRQEAVALLGRLIDKSLVHVEEGPGDRRYRLLETVRQYAAEQLAEAGERETFERRHRDWYIELAESDPTPAGDLPARDRLRRLDSERDNLRAALASALADDPQLALRLTVALWRFWLMRGYLAEGYRWLDASLTAAPEHTADRARALLAACVVGLRRGVHGRLHEFSAESVAIFAELGDHAGMFDAVEVSTAYRAIFSGPADIEALLGEHETLLADDLPAARPPTWAAHTRGIAAWFRHEYPQARQQFELALKRAGELLTEERPALWPLSYALITVAPEVGYPLLLQEDTAIVGRRVGGEAAVAYILGNLAIVDRVEGDFERAGELIEESLARFQRLADVQGEAFALGALGNLARSSGDFERGRELLDRSLVLRQEVGDRRGTGITLGCLAVLDARSGDPAGGRAAAEQSRGWFAENDDMIGLSAAELSLANVALSAGDRVGARAHLQAAASVFGGLQSTHQEGWVLAVLAAMSAEDSEPATARRWLDRATRHFALLGSDAGMAYCREVERGPGVAARSAIAE